MPQSFINASDVLNAREYMMHRCSNILDDRDEFYPFCLRTVCGQTKTNDSHKHRHTNTHTQKHGDKPRLKYTHTQIKQAPTQVQTHTHTTPLPLSVSEPQWGVQRRGHHSEAVLQTQRTSIFLSLVVSWGTSQPCSLTGSPWLNEQLNIDGNDIMSKSGGSLLLCAPRHDVRSRV